MVTNNTKKETPKVKKTEEEKKKEREEKIAKMTPTQKKVFLAKEKLSVISQIDKLERDCTRLEKNIENKRKKIEELALQF